MTPLVLENNDTRLKSRPRFRAIGVGVAGLVVVTGFALFGYARLKNPTLVASADDVVIATAVAADFAPTVRVVAEVAAENPIVVAAPEAGTVVAIFRRNGDYVQAGDVILRLENPALRRDVADDQGRLIAQMGDLVAAESQISGQVQVAENALRDAGYRFANAERDLSRQEALASRGFASEATLERLRAERTHAREIMDAAKVALTNAQRDGKNRLDRIDAVRRSVEGLLSAQSARLSSMEVRAPASGRLTGLQVALGAPVSTAAVLARVEDESRLEVIARLPENRQANVKAGAAAWGEIGGRSIPFRVREIDPTVADGQVRVRLAFVESPPRDLRLGQSIPVQVSLGETRRAIVLPAGAAVGPSRAFVLTGDTAHARPVRLGERSGERIEVIDGIESGDRVIISAPDQIDGVKTIEVQ